MWRGTRSMLRFLFCFYYYLFACGLRRNRHRLNAEESPIGRCFVYNIRDTHNYNAITFIRCRGHTDLMGFTGESRETIKCPKNNVMQLNDSDVLDLFKSNSFPCDSKFHVFLFVLFPISEFWLAIAIAQSVCPSVRLSFIRCISGTHGLGHGAGETRRKERHQATSIQNVLAIDSWQSAFTTFPPKRAPQWDPMWAVGERTSECWVSISHLCSYHCCQLYQMIRVTLE